MNETKRYECQVCGYESNISNEEHECGRVMGIVYEKGQEPKPRNHIDKLMRTIVNNVKEQLIEYSKHPDAEQVHPRMLCALIGCNVIVNLFNDMVSEKPTIEQRKHMLTELLATITDMSLQGLDAVNEAQLQHETKH
jgi:hypothetical protein